MINKVLYNNAYVRTDSYFDNSPLASTGLPSEEELVLLEPFKNQYLRRFLLLLIHHQKQMEVEILERT